MFCYREKNPRRRVSGSDKEIGMLCGVYILLWGDGQQRRCTRLDLLCKTKNGVDLVVCAKTCGSLICLSMFARKKTFGKTNDTNKGHCIRSSMTRAICLQGVPVHCGWGSPLCPQL